MEPDWQTHDTASGTGVAFAPTETKQSELVLLENALISQEMVISTLKERLQPVLTPEYDDEKTGPGGPSPIISRIAELRIKVTDNTNKINELIQRLET